MTQIAVQIPDDLQPFIEHSVKSGLFADAADYLVNLLYNVKAESESELSAEDTAKLEGLRAAVAVGIDQLQKGQRGDFDADDIISRGRARLSAKKALAHA